MQFEREIGRLMFGLLILLFLVMGSSAYWVMTGPESLLLREDNPRQAEFQQSIQRGSLYDAMGVVIAQTVPDTNAVLQRQYLNNAFFGALGYYSFRYGTGGVEASVDPLLSGSADERSWQQWFGETVLHQPRTGYDVQLSLQTSVQEAITSAMVGRSGAIVVLNARTGKLVGLASMPTYDPNTLDTTWETLTKDPDNPFFNRVLQGSYQAGGTLQIPLMAVAHLGGSDTTSELANASAVVQVGDLNLACAIEPFADALSLQSAFSYGCPSPFANLVNTLDETALRTTLDTFALEQSPTIDVALPVENLLTPTPAFITTPEPTTTLLEDALGQGNITVNPLALARYMAAVVNDGTSPALRLAVALRPPNTTTWQAIPSSGLPVSLLTSEAARQLQQWMLASSEMTGIAPEGTGSHVAISRTGEQSLAWFVGFRTIGTDPVVVVVVLENATDVQSAAQIGIAGLNAYVAFASAP